MASASLGIATSSGSVPHAQEKREDRADERDDRHRRDERFIFFKCGQGCLQRGNLRAVICLFNACIEKVQLPVGVVVTLHGDCVDTGTFPN